MSDLFHEDIPVEYIAHVGRVMSQADWHVYQVLTKRHVRMQQLLSGSLRWMSELRHVWFGVSVEDRKPVQGSERLQDGWVTDIATMNDELRVPERIECLRPNQTMGI